MAVYLNYPALWPRNFLQNVGKHRRARHNIERAVSTA